MGVSPIAVSFHHVQWFLKKLLTHSLQSLSGTKSKLAMKHPSFVDVFVGNEGFPLIYTSPGAFV